MVEKWMQTLPFVAPLIARLGQVVGLPDNCHRLLERDELILAFPEGVRGANKLYRHRYQLQRFGSGFMHLALEPEKMGEIEQVAPQLSVAIGAALSGL